MKNSLRTRVRSAQQTEQRYDHNHMNFICLVSWFHLAVSFVNICSITLLLMDRCWSLSEYVVTIFIAFSFTADSWFFFSSDSSDL